MINGMNQRTRIEVSPVGAWVLGTLTTIIVIVMLVVGLNFWSDVPAGDTGGQVFLAIWFAILAVFYLNGLRLLIKRRFTWRFGSFPQLHTTIISLDPVQPEATEDSHQG